MVPADPTISMTDPTRATVATTPAVLAVPVDAPGFTVVDFDDFYRQHRDTVAGALSLTLGDDALGAEAADEGMSRAYERWDTVGRYDNPEGWVYRAALNWARSWLRRRRRGATKDVLVAANERILDRPPDTDLANAIASLPHSQRAVVVLRYHRDWSVEQTASALDIAPGTVKSRLSRALERLEQQLAPHEGTAR